MCTLIAQVLADDMLPQGVIPMDIELLYAWAGGVGCSGLQLKAVSALLLANHFGQVGLKMQGTVPTNYLHQPLHVYFLLLSIFWAVKKWLASQLAVHRYKPLVVPPNPPKLLF